MACDGVTCQPQGWQVTPSHAICFVLSVFLPLLRPAYQSQVMLASERGMCRQHAHTVGNAAA
ncbi:MAG TPA: hypothetical protein VGM01_12100, partial [Ktedonobacteraceae bacterium]